jgi:putative phosphoribosyl transferase
MTRQYAIFNDRQDAGRRLGEFLQDWADDNPLIVGLLRGGLPVAAEVARYLDAPLDAVVARKMGAPGEPELAIGAVAAGGVRVVNDYAIRELGLSKEYIDEEAARQLREVDGREERLSQLRRREPMAGRSVIVVDDGLATGATVAAAARRVRNEGAAHTIIAAPVGSADACTELRAEADDVICLYTPQPFYAVGLHYADFEQVSDEEVDRLLAQYSHSRSP